MGEDSEIKEGGLEKAVGVLQAAEQAVDKAQKGARAYGILKKATSMAITKYAITTTIEVLNVLSPSWPARVIEKNSLGAYLRSFLDYFK